MPQTWQDDHAVSPNSPGSNAKQHRQPSNKQDDWVKARIAAEDYTNDSEYFRDLIRRDQEQSGKFVAPKSAMQEGLDSGVGDRAAGDIWAESEARYKARHA